MDRRLGLKLLEIYKKQGRVSTDSRKIGQDSVFFALKGPNFDGNQYAEQALEGGAAYVVIDDEKIFEKYKGDERYIFSTNVLKSLQELARLYREELAIPVLAIGGSNGKTTTKELLKAVLSTRFRTHATPGNLNNHIGVPLTLLSMPPDTEMAIVELGTNQKGDIAELVEIAEPDFGLITNIGKEHLEGFGGIEGVAREESELFLYLKSHGGLCFVNADDPWLSSMAARLDRVVSYGADPQATVFALLKHSHPGVNLVMDNGLEIQSQLPGAYNFSNILAAMAVARHFGVADWLSKSALETYVSTNNRSQVLEKAGYTFLLDCYNANPSSMEAALKSLASASSDKFFIIGDMLELGSYEEEEHKAIVALTQELGLKNGIFIGPAFGKQLKGDKRAFPSSELAAEYLRENPPATGTLLFLKGSRGIAVEKSVAHWLKDE